MKKGEVQNRILNSLNEFQKLQKWADKNFSIILNVWTTLGFAFDPQPIEEKGKKYYSTTCFFCFTVGPKRVIWEQINVSSVSRTLI